MHLIKSSRLAQIIWEGRKIILIVALISLVLGLAFEKSRTSAWKATIPIVISTSGEKDTADFNYDHFYSLEASDTLTDSLEEWLKSPSVRQNVQNNAKSVFRSDDWKIWEHNNWKVSKKAPQVIEVSFYSISENGAKETEKNLVIKINEYLNSFNQSGKPYFNLTNSTSEVEFVAPNWTLVIILSLIWGIIIGVFIVLEKENLKIKEE